MQRRMLPLSIVTVAAVVFAIIAASTSSAAAPLSGQLTVLGPWQGKDAAAFQSVLNGFTQQNTGVTVAYTPAAGDVAGELASAASSGTAPDLAVLSLPAEQAAMTSLAEAGTLQPIDFAGPVVDTNYSYSWKKLGSVAKHLYGVFFSATNRSAFWYDAQSFKALGLSAPANWGSFSSDVQRIKAHGLSPFAISGGSNVALPSLFQNLYLTFQGSSRYDALASGAIKWNDATVAQTLTKFKRTFGTGIAGGTSALAGSYASAVQRVFGSPLKAYMVPGGSAVLPVLYSAKAVRPLSKFGAFQFPQLSSHTPARVIGDADAVVMTKDSPAARALVQYLATPDAAAIWAKQGGFFLSPNRKLPGSAYLVPQDAQLAQGLAGANTFRFAISDTMPAPFKQTMSLQLRRYLQGTASAGDVMSRLMLAAHEK